MDKFPNPKIGDRVYSLKTREIYTITDVGLSYIHCNNGRRYSKKRGKSYGLIREYVVPANRMHLYA